MTPDELILNLLQETHQQFGMSRFKLGALLVAINDHELWQGRASSFGSFLEEEGIDRKAARQYMTVARTLFDQLRLNDRELQDLSRVSMSLLAEACPLMTSENKDEILGLLSCLGKRDARHEIEQIASDSSSPKVSTRPKGINRAMESFYALPDDERIAFLNLISKPQRIRNANPNCH